MRLMRPASRKPRAAVHSNSSLMGVPGKPTSLRHLHSGPKSLQKSSRALPIPLDGSSSISPRLPPFSGDDRSSLMRHLVHEVADFGAVGHAYGDVGPGNEQFNEPQQPLHGPSAESDCPSSKVQSQLGQAEMVP